MNKSLTKNFFYNLLYQIVTLLTPLITVPYVSRILGKNGIGIFSYTNSITQYFILIGTLGISTYGSRQIAYIRDNKNDLSKTFLSIFLFKGTTTFISFFIYLIIFGANKEYGDVYLIQSLNILAALFDISWLFIGIEDFQKTVTRNLLVKLVCIISIFVFVKSYDDLYKYIFLNALMTLLGNLVMFLYLPGLISKVKIHLKDIFSHFVPTLQLFIPQIAVQIYSILDRTQLGILSNTGEVGLYEQSQKIMRLVLGVLTCANVVMMPRMSNIFANGDTKKMNSNLNKSLNIMSYFSIPMMFGLIGISNEFVPWFFGDDFLPVSYLLICLSPILFFIGLSGVMGNQFLIPSNKTKPYTVSVTLGSLANVTANFILIPKFQAVGACISSVLAESTVVIIQYIILKDNIKLKELCISLLKYTFASSLMLALVRLIGISLGVKVTTTILQILVGTITYILTLFILKENTNLSLLNSVCSTTHKFIGKHLKSV